MKRLAIAGACGLAAWAIGTECRAEGMDRASCQIESERLAAELLPRVAELNGIPNPRPVKVEVVTREELEAILVPELREQYGTDGLERQGRAAAALGLLPPGYDLANGITQLMIATMGGGYDPLRGTLYVLLDGPESLQDPSARRIVVAHELTHALQDQVLDLAAQQRRAIEDWDYDFVYNCVIEGLAYQTMMAVIAGTPLESAPDPTAMLTASLGQLDALPEYSAYAKAPLYLREEILGRALDGVAFVRAWLASHPGVPASSLLERLPASGEQVLHPAKYDGAEGPADIDLRVLDDRIPREWRPYFDNALGEFEIDLLFRAHSESAASAASIADGWDGCRFRVFEDGQGRLALLGASVWDTEDDAAEFEGALHRAFAARLGPSGFAVGRSDLVVRFALPPDGSNAAGLLGLLDGIPSVPTG